MLNIEKRVRTDVVMSIRHNRYVAEHPDFQVFMAIGTKQVCSVHHRLGVVNHEGQRDAVMKTMVVVDTLSTPRTSWCRSRSSGRRSPRCRLTEMESAIPWCRKLSRSYWTRTDSRGLTSTRITCRLGFWTL